MSKSLQHIGVLGMRWGRRKGSPDHNEVQTLKKKKVHQMSNEEIKKVTSRMDLEKRYKDLTKKPMSESQKAAKAFAAEQFKKAAGPFVAAAMTVGMQMIAAYLMKKYRTGGGAGVRIVQDLITG